MLKICLNCNKLVNMHKSKQKYCSRKCTFEAYKNYKPWNTGLTKETDDRVKKLGGVGGDRHSWNYGLTSETNKSVLSMSINKTVKLVSFICNTCGKEIFIKPIELDCRKYCSISCRPSWNKNLSKEIDNRVLKMSNKQKEMYLNGSLDMTKVWAGQKRKLNRHELILDIILRTYFPNEWEYTGDGKMWLTSNHKHLNPDFRYKKEKKVIEYNGSYFHRNDIENNRIKLYNDIGWECLIITENELFKQNDNLLNKIEEFKIK